MAEGTTFADDIVALGDKIAGLTIIKAVELKDYLKEKYKIEPAAGGVVMAAGPGGGGAAGRACGVGEGGAAGVGEGSRGSTRSAGTSARSARRTTPS